MKVWILTEQLVDDDEATFKVFGSRSAANRHVIREAGKMWDEDFECDGGLTVTPPQKPKRADEAIYYASESVGVIWTIVERSVLTR